MAVQAQIPFVIVGGGLASAKAAETIRQEGASGAVVLLSRDVDRPYHRPPLSKDFLRGETKRDDVFVHSEDWAREQHVDIQLGVTVERLDVTNHALTLNDGSTVGFERLLLATGAWPRSLPVPGAGLEGVLQLRTLRDSAAIQQAAQGKRRAVMIGGGFIGAEIAASLRQMGLETAVIARERVLWEHLFGAQLSGVFQRTLADHGVQILNGDEAARIEGAGRVERVVTKAGHTLDGDLVVFGVGASPETKLAEGTSLKVENGIVTDQYLQTNAPGIYAAGDVARFYSPLYEQLLRVEHWDVAQQQGEIAGRNLAREAAGNPGARQAVDQPPYFFSDLFDLSMEYLGYNQGWDEIITRGDPAGNEFTGFYLKARRLVAALFIRRNADVEPSRALIQRRLQVDDQIRHALSDPSTDLASM
jgi:3-phenylpropionate/trans-cinnamate dioxygenase ferredoxin reductase subunit